MALELKKAIKAFKPFNEQEERDKELLLHALEMDNIFSRENQICHFTASAWVVNEKKDKVLMAYHCLYDSWAWLGGHADGEKELLKTAIKEVKEESGLKIVKPVIYDIFSIESLAVNGHFKGNQYVSSHLHFNVTYLLEANENDPLIVKEGENTKLAWFLLDDAIEASDEKWFKDYIYPKLNQKLKKITT